MYCRTGACSRLPHRNKKVPEKNGRLSPELFLFFKGRCELLEAFFKGRPGAGDVDALEAAAFAAEYMAAVEPEMGFFDDAVIQFLAVESVVAEVEPDEIGSFWFDEMDLGQFLGEKAAGTVEVLPEVGLQLPEPVRPVGIGGLGRGQAEGIWLAIAGCLEGVQEAAAVGGILDKDIGNLQTGQVEAFAW